MKKPYETPCIEKTDEIAYWSCDEESEDLIHTSINAAVEMWLNLNTTKFTKLTVYGYRRMYPCADVYSGAPLECLLDSIDEEYGDPDGHPVNLSITEKMKEAEKTFIDTIISEYEPWACERCCQTDIDVPVWIEEYRPDWLKE